MEKWQCTCRRWTSSNCSASCWRNFIRASRTKPLLRAAEQCPGKVITADGNLLARLFDNLINNAIKYGADGKRVLVQIHAEEEVVTVSVTNYGYVIPADELPLYLINSTAWNSRDRPTRAAQG